MNDLTLKELKFILSWFKHFEETVGTLEEDDDLADALKKMRDEKEELESMDLEDCAGGACKL